MFPEWLSGFLPRSPSVFERFETVALGCPDKIALEYDHQQLSYAELLAQANQLASRLATLPTHEASRVAICFENRVYAISSILAILRAGHTFISLDPADPDTRLQVILEDSSPIAVMTDTANLYRVKQIMGDTCAIIDISAPLPRKSPHKLAPPFANDLAYLFYTSGSTGKPKGVVQSQANLLYYIDTYSRHLDITSRDRLSLLYTLSFGAANMDIFGALLNGATLCAYDMRRQGIPGLQKWIEEKRITVMHTVPTIFRKLTLSLPAGKILDSVRVIDLGGETLTGQDVIQFQKCFSPSCRLFNRLASTEVCVIAHYPVSAADSQREILPVGYPPDQLKVRIVQPNGQPARQGERGRIVISSPYISPGYWQRDELNQACFRKSRWRPGWRLFFTEDTGYIDKNGMLFFWGREGSRIKIRGQSIDTSEVEAALRKCRGINDVAVVATYPDASPEADALVAHVVTESHTPGNPITLRRELATYLPSYMLPAVYVFADSLPLTASGKIDRRALQSVVIPTSAQDTSTWLAPATKDEEEVARLFEVLLHRSSVSRDDDFFLIGGDSLTAVELQIRLSALAGKSFPLGNLIQDATVQGIARQLDILRTSERVAQLSPVLVPLREQGETPIVFLVHGRLGQAPVSPLFLSLFGERQAIYALQARGLEKGDKPNESIEAMAADYVNALRLVQPHGPYLICGMCAGAYVATQMAVQLIAMGETVLPLLLLDPKPFTYHLSPETKTDHALRKNFVYRVKKSLHKRDELGWGNTDIDSQEGEQAAIQVAVTFRKAMTKYRPQPYPHPVTLIASSKRCGSEDGWNNIALQKNIFSGPLQIIEVAEQHDDIFNISNERFVGAVSDHMHAIQNHSLYARQG